MKWWWFLFPILFGILIYNRFYSAGYFRPEIKNFVHGTYHKCYHVEGPEGIEDVAINPKTGLAFLSSLNKMKLFFQGEDDLDAGIFTYDLSKGGSQKILKLPLIGFPPNRRFHPHGLSFFEKDNEELLFVVNHEKPTGDESLDIFEYKNNQLIFRQSVTHPLIKSLNDVVAMGPNSFYATNDHYSKKSMFLEEIFNFCWANVIYYDGKEVKEMVSGLCLANGINVSPDGNYIYVTESNAGTLDFFIRDKSTNQLTLKKKLFLDAGVDNIEVSGNDLLIGANRGMADMIANLTHGTPIPSYVFKVKTTNEPTVEILYSDDGKERSAISVASSYENRLLISTAMHGPIMICE